MKDIALNEFGTDIKIENYDLSLVDGVEATRQRLRAKLLLFRGEWFLDRRAGVPWFEEVFRKRPRGEAVRAAIRRPLIDDPEVESIVRFDVTYEPVGRKTVVEAEVALTGGDRVIISAEPEVE